MVDVTHGAPYHLLGEYVSTVRAPAAQGSDSSAPLVSTERVAVALVGPTASGKSALAHSLAFDQHDAVEILCVDAMTVYRGMDLGTAKPTRAERAEVQLPPPRPRRAERGVHGGAVSSARRASRPPTSGAPVTRSSTWAAPDSTVARCSTTSRYPAQYPHVRALLEERAHDELPALYAELETLDPLAASRMEPTNARRIVRALEVTLGAGRPFSSYGEGLVTYGPARVVQVALQSDFEQLDVRIASRFRAWMDQGLLEEVIGARRARRAD